eukprot:COSAG06_NODE_14122_length_1187_cov_3.952206_1_plen_238_part_10
MATRSLLLRRCWTMNEGARRSQYVLSFFFFSSFPACPPDLGCQLSGRRSRTSRPAGSVSARSWEQDIDAVPRFRATSQRAIRARPRPPRWVDGRPPRRNSSARRLGAALSQHSTPTAHAQTRGTGDSWPRCGLPRISSHECKCFSVPWGRGKSPPIQSAPNHPPARCKPSRQASSASVGARYHTLAAAAAPPQSCCQQPWEEPDVCGLAGAGMWTSLATRGDPLDSAWRSSAPDRLQA